MRCAVHMFLLPSVSASVSPSGAAYQAGILSAASRAEMADVEQMKKIVPFVTCVITFGQNVCKLMFGINVSNLNFKIKINPVKQPIQSNSMVDTCLIVGLRPFIIIFKNI